MSDLSDDLRKAADNPASIWPRRVRDEFRKEAAQIEASDERWARLAGRPTTEAIAFKYDTKETP